MSEYKITSTSAIRGKKNEELKQGDSSPPSPAKEVKPLKIIVKEQKTVWAYQLGF